MALLVTYDLHTPGMDYSGLIHELKSPPTYAWWHHLGSTWILRTGETPRELFHRIAPHLDTNDRIFVIEIDDYPECQGWLPRRAWEWLKER
jgi:hypothetical protein